MSDTQLVEIGFANRYPNRMHSRLAFVSTPPLFRSATSTTCCMATSTTREAATKPQVDLGTLATTCAKLVAKAGQKIRDVHESRAAGAEFKVVYKDASDARTALTKADAASQAVIVPALRHHFPGVAVIGEEESDDEFEGDADDMTLEPDDSLRLGSADSDAVSVFVDPVDGTLEFVQGNLANVQTLAGICIHGRPVAGAISLPFAPGAPVITVTPTGIIGLEKVTHYEHPVEGVVAAVSKRPTGLIAEVLDVIAPAKILEIGAAGNKMLRIATGEVDIVVLNLVTSLWDTAAPEALVRASGGEVTDFFGVRLPHGPKSRLSNCFGVIATSKNFSARDAKKRTHRELCADIRASMVADGLLQATGIQPLGVPQATDIARDLNGDPLTLQFFHDNIHPSVKSFSAPEASAVRYLMSDACRINLDYGEGDGTPTSMFFKRVVMADLPHVQLKMRTAPEKIARDVKSYQVEAAFLGSRACSELVELGAHIARPYHVESRPAPDGTPLIQSKFLLIMQDFASKKNWAQYGLLNADQTRACLDSLAQIHAYFWDFGNNPNADELTSAVWDCGSYWAPSRQPTTLFDKLDSCWRKQLASFSDAFAKARVEDDSTERTFPLEELGGVLGKYARDIADRVHSVGVDKKHRHRTIVHGDPKAANFFLRKVADADTWDVGVIDFQWCGWGHPALDVAYLISTSSSADVLCAAGELEMEMIQYYLAQLRKYFVQFCKASDEKNAESLLTDDEMQVFYNEALLDIARLVISYHWDRINASPDVLESRKDKLGSNSYNKNVDCAIWLVRRTWCLLSHMEANA